MTTTGVLLVASTCLYGGFQWTIRILVYPQLARVPADGFTGYEQEHQHRVSIAVAPLFAFFGGSAIAAVAIRPGPAAVAVAGCFALILIVTGLAAVPLHRRLTTGFDPVSIRRLLIVDSVRLTVAALACVAAATFALAG